MLNEHFIAAIGAPSKAPSTSTQKDASIFIHEFQPLLQQRSTFKKSATAPDCLAINESHIFAAQAEKAVVHVYSREKGNQEATVPFPERITCLALACDDSVLVLGTVEGRILLWEIASGRQITTSQAHLQAVNVLAVDPTSNFLLSASADSTVHVWSLPALLSFVTVDVQSVSPLSTFAAHRAEVMALALGHSSSFCNFAVSTSKDKTCLLWDYHTGTVMRTYLLPEVPTCVALDAADRFVYFGYEDGSLQQVNLFDIRSESRSDAPVQPHSKSRWVTADGSLGAVLSLSISFDGYTVLTGYHSGAICSWDSAKGAFGKTILQHPLPGPVTNLSFLPVSRFPNKNVGTVTIPTIVKPKFGAFDNPDGEVPGSYSVNVSFPSNLQTQTQSAFEQALTSRSFPQGLLEAGLAELVTWGKQSHNNADAEVDADFMALDEDGADRPKKLTLEEENAQLKLELEALRRVQRASFDKMEKMRLEQHALLKRQAAQQRRHVGVNGAEKEGDWTGSEED